MVVENQLRTVAIVGQGYVGLPLAQAATKAGFEVIGFDKSESTVKSLERSRSHVDDLSDDDIAEMIALGYRPTSDESKLANASTFVICVPTPLSKSGGPDLTAVELATHSIAANMKPRATVILESTTYPGTTEGVIKPILESYGWVHGTDFYLAFSPERVDPGRKDYTITNTPKVVGGVNQEDTDSAVNFYNKFVEMVVPVSGTREAETAKLLENTYRHVNIALVNEMAMFCHDLGIDIWEVVRAASTKPFGFQKFTPGPGVGGHCIPIDPNYLSFEVKKQLGYPFHFVELAQEINAGMPKYVTERIGKILNNDRKALNGSEILLLGVTYKPNIKDQRESPALPVAQQLVASGAIISYHDPHVEVWNVDGVHLDRTSNLNEAIRKADLVVLLQDHESYNLNQISKFAKRFFDTRGVTNCDGVLKL